MFKFMENLIDNKPALNAGLMLICLVLTILGMIFGNDQIKGISVMLSYTVILPWSAITLLEMDDQDFERKLKEKDKNNK